MKRILGICFALVFSMVAFMGQAKEAQANKQSTWAEALSACKAEGKIGKELSGCIRAKMDKSSEVSQTEDEVEVPDDSGEGEGEGY